MFSDSEGHVAFLTMLAIVGFAALVGASASATVSGVAYLMEENENATASGFWASVAGGAVSGAITGAFSGVVLITGGSALGMIGASALVGAIASGAGEVVGGVINGNIHKDGFWKETVIPATIWGGVFGAVLGVAGGEIKPVAQLAKDAGKSVAVQLKKILVHELLKKTGGLLVEGMLGDSFALLGQLIFESAYSYYRPKFAEIGG